jgi:hypothetical protein
MDELLLKDYENIMKQAAHLACTEYTDFLPVLVSSVPCGFLGQQIDTRVVLFHADFGIHSFHLISTPPFVPVDRRETISNLKADLRGIMDKFVVNATNWYGACDAESEE